MSIQAMYTAATGMQALETKLNVIAHNLANVNTTGFKKDRANFQDLIYQTERLPGAQDDGGGITPIGKQIGMGVQVQGVQTDYRQGSYRDTGRPLDVAIQGNGFFQVSNPDGEIVYTRAGTFTVNAQNQLVIASAGVGRLLDPQISLPDNYEEVSIQPDGRVMVKVPGQQGLTEAGRLQLASFVNEEGLLKRGENLYSATDASGQPQQDNPGNQGLGFLQSNGLESSNVEPVEELIDLITTQRSFELNSQAIRAGDEFLQLVATLRR
jgi:flagellar basal-body rod protein FlgG